MFVVGIYWLGSISDKTWESKLGLFRSYEWDDSAILTTGWANLISLKVSEGKLCVAVGIFHEELRYDPKFKAALAHPVMLMFSMERRVRPRNMVYKKLIMESYSLYTALVETESEFLEQYVN